MYSVDLNGKIVDNAANSGALGAVPAPMIGRGLPTLLAVCCIRLGARLLKDPTTKRRSLGAAKNCRGPRERVFDFVRFQRAGSNG